MTEMLGMAIVDGQQNANNIIRQGPSIECEMHFNYTIDMILDELAVKCGLPSKNYWISTSALSDLLASLSTVLEILFTKLFLTVPRYLMLPLLQKLFACFWRAQMLDFYHCHG